MTARLFFHYEIGGPKVTITAVCPEDAGPSCRITRAVVARYDHNTGAAVLMEFCLMLREAGWAAYFVGADLRIRCRAHKGKPRPDRVMPADQLEAFAAERA